MKYIQTIPTCETCDLQKFSVFKHLTKIELANLSIDKGCNFFKRGNVLYNEGNRINGFYCVNQGVVKLVKTGIEGREQIIRFAQKGDIIGYRSILSKELACTTAKVIDDAVVCFIPASKLFGLVQNNNSFAMELMKLACKELGEANKFILDIAQKTVRERLAEVLMLLRETFGLDEDHVLQILLTREELANIVGTATESVIRLLSEFKSDKIIALNGRKIQFLNENTLIRLSNFYE